MKFGSSRSSVAVSRNPIYLILLKFLSLYVVVGMLLRVVLMLTTPSSAGFTWVEVVRCLLVGVLSDVGMGVLLSAPLSVLYLGLNEVKYSRSVGAIILILLLAAFGYSLWPGSIFYEYGGGAPKVAHLFLGWKLLSFSLRYFFPRLREPWRCVSLYVAWGVYVGLFLLVTVGEYMFWQEFGVRYNFIAVDYLVYTHEVIGNIMESYAFWPLCGVLLLLTLAIVWWQSRRYKFKLKALYGPKLLVVHLGVYLIMCLLGYGLVGFSHSLSSGNQYVTQVEQNGACNFVLAFCNNRLEYDKFYPMLPEQQCKSNYLKLAQLDSTGTKIIGDDRSSKRANIVLLTVESLSADFLTRYGNREHITPYLDKLMQEGLVFDSLYANGNRTVRGLEALSLCVPPSAGESIIKQKENRMGQLSIGKVLDRLGYRSQFLYGGDSYFDNMGDFFSKNGYEVIDRNVFKPGEVTFANIWGVCDEDMLNKSLSVFDTDAKSGHPFFAQIMTTSNHRPYTYPEGRIKVAGDPHTREAAVKYTDYAIGRFFQQAALHPWFKNTVFIIIADHCASSAGKTSLPVYRYHIPCIVYAPALLKPQVVSKVCSQIDVMPTVLSLLHLRAAVHFAGQDVFSPSFRPRAFMATYQDLGYLEDNCLTVLSPVRKVQQYRVEYLADGTTQEIPLAKPRSVYLQKALAYYQYTNMYLKKQCRP